MFLLCLIQIHTKLNRDNWHIHVNEQEQLAYIHVNEQEQLAYIHVNDNCVSIISIDHEYNYGERNVQTDERACYTMKIMKCGHFLVLILSIKCAIA